jgi:hypothetical protein
LGEDRRRMWIWVPCVVIYGSTDLRYCRINPEILTSERYS